MTEFISDFIKGLLVAVPFLIAFFVVSSLYARKEIIALWKERGVWKD